MFETRQSHVVLITDRSIGNSFIGVYPKVIVHANHSLKKCWRFGNFPTGRLSARDTSPRREGGG